MESFFHRSGRTVRLLETNIVCCIVGGWMMKKVLSIIVYLFDRVFFIHVNIYLCKGGELTVTNLKLRCSNSRPLQLKRSPKNSQVSLSFITLNDNLLVQLLVFPTPCMKTYINGVFKGSKCAPFYQLQSWSCLILQLNLHCCRTDKLLHIMNRVPCRNLVDARHFVH